MKGTMTDKLPDVGDGKHKCPIDGCEELLPYNILMCRGHWRLVPGAIQGQVYTWWKAFQRGGKGAAERYLEVRKAAIDAVQGGAS
jgi:hypothetical protein